MKGDIFFLSMSPPLRRLIAVSFLPPPLCRENAILSRGLDECQARLVVVGLSYVKIHLHVCFAAK